MNLLKKIVLVTLSSVFCVGLGVSSFIPHNDVEVNAATSTAKHNQFWIYDENKVGVKLQLTNITYETGYDKDDLVSWFNNFKGSVDTDSAISSNKCNYTILSDTSSGFIVGQQTIVTGSHYGRSGDHRIYLFPKFVTSLTCQAMKWSTSKKLGSTITLSGGYRVVRGVYCNGGSNGETYTGMYKDDSMTNYTRNMSFNQYTVTYKYGSTNLASETRVEYTLPTKLNATYTVAEKEFKGWYTTDTFTTEYTEKAISADITIYARFVSLNYIYFGFKGDEWNDLYVYGFDSNGYLSHGTWPGTLIEDSLIAHEVCFDTINGYGLAKIPVYESYGFAVINNGKNSTDLGAIQTNNLKVTAGNYYAMSDDTNATGSDIVGEAAEFVFSFNKVICLTTNKSLCEINIPLWLENYNNLSDDAKNYAKIASITTINSNPEIKGDGDTASYTVQEMIDVLERKVLDTTNLSSRLLLSTNNASNNFIIIIVSLSLVAGIIISYSIYKRKHQ